MSFKNSENLSIGVKLVVEDEYETYYLFSFVFYLITFLQNYFKSRQLTRHLKRRLNPIEHKINKPKRQLSNNAQHQLMLTP